MFLEHLSAFSSKFIGFDFNFFVTWLRKKNNRKRELHSTNSSSYEVCCYEVR